MTFNLKGALNHFSLELSPDSSEVVQIIISILSCDFHFHNFTLTLDPRLPVTNSRFSARAVPVSLGPQHTHTLDIDGVFFDADGDDRKEQALGGLSFVSGLIRCNGQWWATSISTDNDNDGWNDVAGTVRLAKPGQAILSQRACRQ